MQANLGMTQVGGAETDVGPNVVIFFKDLDNQYTFPNPKPTSVAMIGAHHAAPRYRSYHKLYS